jgi:hypothetical protein
VETHNDYVFDCEAVFTVHISATSPRAANEIFKEYVANVDIPANARVRGLHPAVTSASVQVQDAPVFAYGHTPNGDEIDDDGLPPEADDWQSLLSALGQGAYVAALAIANWEENTEADRIDKLGTIRDQITLALGRLQPGGGETSPTEGAA